MTSSSRSSDFPDTDGNIRTTGLVDPRPFRASAFFMFDYYLLDPRSFRATAGGIGAAFLLCEDDLVDEPTGAFGKARKDAGGVVGGETVGDGWPRAMGSRGGSCTELLHSRRLVGAPELIVHGTSQETPGRCDAAVLEVLCTRDGKQLL